MRKPAQLTGAHLLPGLRERRLEGEGGTRGNTSWSTALSFIKTVIELPLKTTDGYNV